MAVMVKKMKEFGRPATASQSQEVEFSFSAPAAKKVSVAGTFNNWNTSSMPMKKGKDGTWALKLKLAPGRYEYKFFVDGAWVQDVSCHETASNAFGTYNSVIGIKAA